MTVEIDYQLAVEHAALVAEHDLPCSSTRRSRRLDRHSISGRSATPTQAGLTHFVTPGEVVSLAQACFGAAPPCYLLGVRAHHMDDFAEGLTPDAEAGLEAALVHLVRFIERQVSGTARLETSDARR